MFTNSNDILTGRRPVVTPSGCEVVAQRGAIALAAADLDANDAGSVCILPAGCVPVGITYDSDDLDTNGTPTIVAAVGLMTADDNDLATVWVTGVSASQNGTSAVLTSRDLMRVAPATTDRRVGVKFTAGSATKAAGTVGLTMQYRAA